MSHISDKLIPNKAENTMDWAGATADTFNPSFIREIVALLGTENS